MLLDENFNEYILFSTTISYILLLKWPLAIPRINGAGNHVAIYLNTKLYDHVAVYRNIFLPAPTRTNKKNKLTLQIRS
jgi:hypothetical protein